jgi:hypothetical protein
MFGHSWEWAGFLNYTKALPSYQGDLSIQNQFTYYFTNQLGGRVYATGSNQEGYFVTAAGLTDLSTNETLGVADLGSYFPESNNQNISSDITGGLGIDVSDSTVKLKVPALTTAPSIGSSPEGAIDGSLYWNPNSGALFILYNDGTSRQWVQTSTGGIPVVVVNDNYTASVPDYVVVTASGKTITLPATPSPGDALTVVVAGTWLNTVVGRNGSNIMGLSQNLTLDKKYAAMTFTYIDSTNGWRLS